MNAMTKGQLEAIKARAKGAIEHINGRDPYVTAKGGIVLLYGPYSIDRANLIADFYREARSDIPALVAEVESLQTELRNILEILDDAYINKLKQMAAFFSGMGYPNASAGVLDIKERLERAREEDKDDLPG